MYLKNSIELAYRNYHPVVWLLVVGTIFTRIASTMTMPFLALYLSRNTNMSLTLIGLTVGIGSLTGMFGGFIGGILSDKFGRKKIMMISLYAGVLVFAGFGMAHQVWMFPVLNAINGIVRVFFEPISQAMIGDVTPPEKRARAFGLRYLAINIGATGGPLLGALLGMSASGIGFWITSAVNLVYALVLGVYLRETLPGLKASPLKNSSESTREIKGPLLKKQPYSWREVSGVLLRDRSLLLFILAGIVANFGYSQINSTLPVYLREILPGSGDLVYSSLNALNALQVVLIQIPFSYWMERRSPLFNCVLGSIGFGVGYILFGLSSVWWMFGLSMMVLTVGEVLNFPSGSQVLDRLAGEELRGTYFGASSFRNLGMFLGPSVGLWLLPKIGGTWVFISIGVAVILSSYLYVIGDRIWQSRSSSAHLPGQIM